MSFSINNNSLKYYRNAVLLWINIGSQIMSHIKSDLMLLSNYTVNPHQTLSQEDYYRTFSAMSYFDFNPLSEEHLDSNFKFLTRFRRNFYNNKIKKEELLSDILRFESSYQGNTPLIIGDAKVLKGHVYQQMGNYALASQLHSEASQLFLSSGDEFRGLRAIINSKIFNTEATTSYESGELYVLLKKVIRENYFDLAGNIYRGLAMELFNQSQYAEARVQIDLALKCFSKLSYPDDEAIAQCLSSLIWLQLGQPEKAKIEFESISVYSRKLHYYLEAVKACLAGAQPLLPSTHPLAKAQWSHFQLRTRSIVFKIVETLKNGPLTRDEIIYQVWGEHALSDSYCNRLYVALNQIKKKKIALIIFNGEKYELKNSN